MEHNRPFTLTQTERQALYRETLRYQPESWGATRPKMLLLADLGLTPEDVAEWITVSPAVVQPLIDAYVAGGIAGVQTLIPASSAYGSVDGELFGGDRAILVTVDKLTPSQRRLYAPPAPYTLVCAPPVDDWHGCTVHPLWLTTGILPTEWLNAARPTSDTTNSSAAP